MLTPRILALFALAYISLEVVAQAQAHDCQMTVVPMLPVHVVNGPIPLKVTFTNSGTSLFSSFRNRDEMFRVPTIKFYKLTFFQFAVRNAEGQLLGNSSLVPRKPFTSLPRFMEQHAWISLRPGKSIEHNLLLNHWLHLPRGSYTIECVYQLPADSKMVATFNVKVEEPTPDLLAKTVECLALPLELEEYVAGEGYLVLAESLRSIVKNSSEWGLPPQFVETILKTNPRLSFLSRGAWTRNILVEKPSVD